MSSLMDLIQQHIGGDTMKKIGREIGADEKQAGAATSAAVTTLLAALQRNASRPEGAAALHKALAKDHDGQALDRADEVVSNPQAVNAEGMLRHILGAKRGAVENGIGAAAGLKGDGAGKLLTMLAPMVMGALGKAQRTSNLDAGQMADFLGQQRREVESREPKSAGLLGKLLDADGDGDVDLSDLAKQGSGLLGKFFKR